MAGIVEQILITTREGEAMTSVETITAHEGRGLEGDRYYEGTGKFKSLEPKRQATFIEAEAIEAVARDYGLDVTAVDARRNIVTRGVPLNHLVGKEFTIGDASFRGIKLCEPCDYMQKLAGKPIRDPLKHRGGLRAEILATGTVAVGDALSF